MPQRYIESVLVAQLQSLGLNRRQRELVAADVSMRLESLLSHWTDIAFRRAVLLPGAEEASFWEPASAPLEIRSLVVVAVRNSLITDLNASRAYTVALRSSKEQLPDRRMPWLTGEAVRYFQGTELEGLAVQPSRDIFGSLPGRFPNAWHVLSLLGNSSEDEIACRLPAAEAEPLEEFSGRRAVKGHTVIESGIDPGLDGALASVLRQIERRQVDVFFTFAFKGITRNPEKLLAVIDHVLRHGGTVLTPNYLLSPAYLARRNPLVRPAHTTAEIGAQVANPDGLSRRHAVALASLAW